MATLVRSKWWQRPWRCSATLVDGLALLPWANLRTSAVLPIGAAKLSQVVATSRRLEVSLVDSRTFESVLESQAQPSLEWKSKLEPGAQAWVQKREDACQEWTFVLLENGEPLGLVSFQVQFMDILKLPKTKKTFIWTPFHSIQIPNAKYQSLCNLNEDRFVDLPELLSEKGVHVVARSKFKLQLEEVFCRTTLVGGNL